MTTAGICLDPLDVLFFRDGRPFGAASRVTSGWPTPQVLAGAVRTALLEKYGCPFEALKKQSRTVSFIDCLPVDHRWIGGIHFRGPWLCQLPDSAAGNTTDVPDLFLSVPSTIHVGKKGLSNTVHLLEPLQKNKLPGWHDPQELRPLWLKGTDATEAALGFINATGLFAFLMGQKPEKDQLSRPDQFSTLDNRTGIGIHADKLVTGDGEIYGVSFLSLKKGYGFYAEVVLPEDAPGDALSGIQFLAFGGEGKRVRFQQVKPFSFPASQTTNSNSKTLILLTTPSVVDSTGIPSSIKDRTTAAAINSPIAISGWDLARGGPKPTRFAAPAGSVYFLNDALPPPDLTDELGYGCYLQGVWNDV
ncbi:MAG TPA: type III-B CRISPR module-associated protein Cmr3 [Gemmata sp.]|jgi:CRISPR-associated protein Cmr3|nr:type III-B CRISPR module-associated protein Cmr3 [Gemmata sp.]